MNWRPCGLQFAAKRVVIGKLQMVRFGMRISRRADGLEVRSRERRFVSGERTICGRAAGRKDNRADCRECDRDERAELFQGGDRDVINRIFTISATRNFRSPTAATLNKIPRALT